jgi:hypothetical protein
MALFRRQIMSGLSALNAVSDVLNMTDVGNINEITFYIVGSAGIGAGAVQVEEAHADDYAGAWAPNGSPVNAVVSGEATVKITGVSAAMRARISTAIVGGTVDIWAVGR